MRRALTGLILLSIFGALISLGFWQLQRADEKRQLLDNFASRSTQPPIALTGALLEGDRSGSPAEIVGHYEEAGQFLWDNRTYEGQPGFHVITPFVIDGSETRILIDRGWIPLEGSRDRLPRPEVPQGGRNIIGHLYAPSKGFTLEGSPPDYGAPLRQNLDLDVLRKKAAFALQPYVLRLSPDDPDGFLRAWSAPERTSVQRHQAYAVQWFGMAAVFVIALAAFNRRQKRRSHIEGKK